MSKFVAWIDQRLPVSKFVKNHLSEYYAPKNFNFFYFFGSLALFVFILQIITGIFLTINYKPDATSAFASVEYIMRDVFEVDCNLRMFSTEPFSCSQIEWNACPSPVIDVCSYRNKCFCI